MDSNMVISIHSDQIPDAVRFVEQHLDRGKITGKERTRAVLMTEESLLRLFAHAEEGKEIRISILRFMGNISIILRSPGEEFDFFGDGLADMTLGIDIDPDEELIRDHFLKAFEDKLRYQHRKHWNLVRVTAVRSRYAALYMTVGGMLLGILVGLLLKAAAPQTVSTLLNDRLFSQVTAVFMNLLKTVVGPVVFFSIASSIAGFGDLSATGRIGGKIMGLYIGVSLIAIGVGIGTFFVFRPGDPLLTGAMNAAYTVDTAAVQDISVIDMIVNIVPSNILRPFLEADMLQIIFLSVIVGAGAAMIGNYAGQVRMMLDIMNDLFLKITMIFIRLIPVAAFCSMASMVLTAGGDAFFSVLHICIVIIISYFVMIAVYALMLASGGVNPVVFYKKYFPTMMQVFAISSSNASIPMNMSTCDEKLGISSKVYSLSIPLGATINMHGSAICLVVTTLAFAKAFGVSISGGNMLGMIISIILLSMGAPGIPGANLVVQAVLLAQFGIPIAAVSLVIGINPLIDMFITAVNCLGDVATTAVVAKSENLMDMDRFRA